MSYETIQSFSGIVGLLFFVVLFVGIVFWAYHPKNKKKMEDHGTIPLKEEDNR